MLRTSSPGVLGARAAAVAGTAAVALLLPGHAAAVAAGGPSDGGCLTTCAHSDADGWTAGAGATITLEYRGGGGGGTSSRPASVAGPPPPCRMVRGNDVADQEPSFGHGDEVMDWEGAGYDAEWPHLPIGHEENLTKEGAYWVPTCLGADSETSQAFFATHRITFVEAGTPPPPPPPPTVEQLRQVAYQHLSAPAPDVDLNPGGTSLVHLPTWVWVDEQTFTEVGVRASAGGNWTEVTATPTGMGLSSPGGRQEGSCASGGTPWSPGAAATDCAVVFERSSAASGPWSLTVSTTWSAAYEDSEGGSGALDGSGTESTIVDVAVGEVQALVGP
ncbi:hypothetical protein WDZ16_10805 [Pseudokineococcus marinus]|uniref:Secreted protein n=1 Tax=Pseudokineococcus marinus TaxID=351215 RepID=A0A849BGJ6_9ACTN|nr:hypothetical protein [Pseudokineococcus marinus]NNH22220.1 hypothetical protein [Pseudokineococcus marinus]